MPKAKASKSPPIDVLVLGAHPACYLAATVLKQAGVRVAHALIPDEPLRDRLVIVNPELFDLHKMLAGLKRTVDLEPVYGLRFLADDPHTRCEFIGKSISAHITDLADI